jgi:hypothetical protein
MVPVTAVPGLTPRSPLTVVLPVLVTVEAARTPKVVAVPRGIGAWTAVASWGRSMRTTAMVSPVRIRFVSFIPARVALSSMQNAVVLVIAGLSLLMVVVFVIVVVSLLMFSGRSIPSCPQRW